VPVSITAGGLVPSSTYHFRVVAQNELGTSAGADGSLTTTAPEAAGGGRGGGAAAPDLALAASADHAAVEAGGAVLVRAQVRLDNPAASSGASDAVLTAVLPPGSELVSTRVNRGPGCTGATTVVCPLSFVSAGIVGEVELRVRLSRAGSASLALSVRATEADPDPADNAATVTVTVTGAPAATAVDDKAPRIVLRRPATAGPRRAVVRGARATIAADLSVDEAARLRLRVVDLRSGRAVRLAAGSRLGAKRLAARAAFVQLALSRAGTVRASAVLRRASLRVGRRYALELVAVDRGGRRGRLRVPFRL
jgi:hypothetical protein